MSQGTAESLSPDQVAHEHFMGEIARDPRYTGFGRVEFDPEAHRLDDVLRSYHNNPAETAYYVGFAGLVLAGEEGFAKAEQAVKDALEEYKIPDRIKAESFIFNANHIHFADDPLMTLSTIRAATALGMYDSWEEAASHMYEVVARSVDVLATNITKGSVVENGLRHISNMIKTLPGSEKAKAIPGLSQDVRRAHNEKVKNTYEDVSSAPGNFIIGNAAGEQEEVGTVYRIKAPREKSAELLYGRQVLSVLVKCVPTIVNQELATDEMTLVHPIGLYTPEGSDDVDAMYEDQARAAAKLLPAHGYPELEVVRYKGKEFYTQAA